MTDKQKKLNLKDFIKKQEITDLKEKSNKNFSIKLNNINIKNTKLNKNSNDSNFSLNNNKKANYFDSNNKTNQNNELIKLKSDDFLKSNFFKYIKIEKNNELFNFNLTSKIKLLNLFSKAFKNFIDVLVSEIKLKGINSKFRFKFQNLELKKNIQKNLTLINYNQKKLNFFDIKEQEQNKEIKITKLIYTEKKTNKILDNNKKILTISLPFNLKRLKNLKLNNKFSDEKNNLSSIEKKGKFIGNDTIGFVDEKTNKGKYAILNFL